MTIIEGVGDEVTVFLVTVSIVSVVFLYLSYFTGFSPLGVFSQWMQQEVVEQQEAASSLQTQNKDTERSNLQDNQSVSTTLLESTVVQDAVDNIISTGGTSSDSETIEQIVSSVESVDFDNCVNAIPHEAFDKSSEEKDQPFKAQCNKEVLGGPSDHASLRQRRLEFFSKSEKTNSGTLETETLNRQSESSNCAEHVAETPNDHKCASTSSLEGNLTQNEAVDSIRVRLKYLNDTERLVYCKLEEKIGEFKRKHFSENLASNEVVRFIYNGQLLQVEERTLASYGISDNCVIHVHISQTWTPPGSPTTDADGDLDLSNFLWPLLAIIIVILWFLHFQYRELFNIASTVVLLGITIFFAAVWGQTGLRGRNTRLPAS